MIAAYLLLAVLGLVLVLVLLGILGLLTRIQRNLAGLHAATFLFLTRGVVVEPAAKGWLVNLDTRPPYQPTADLVQETTKTLSRGDGPR